MIKEPGFSTDSNKSSKFNVEPSEKLVSENDARSLRSPGLAARVADKPFLLPLVPPIKDTAAFIIFRKFFSLFFFFFVIFFSANYKAVRGSMKSSAVICFPGASNEMEAKGFIGRVGFELDEF